MGFLRFFPAVFNLSSFKGDSVFIVIGVNNGGSLRSSVSRNRRF